MHFKPNDRPLASANFGVVAECLTIFIIGCWMFAVGCWIF
jgi:hypothetical protein